MTDPSDRPAEPSTTLQLARAVRRLVRWLLLCGVLVAAVVWIVYYDCSGFALVAWCWVWWVSLGMLATIATGVEILAARRRHDELLRVRPSWGLALWIAAPVLFAVGTSW